MMHGGGYGGMGGMMGGYSGYGYGTGAVEVILWIAILAIIIWLAYYFYKGSSRESGKKAIEILNERYARGEITREEYMKMKEELR